MRFVLDASVAMAWCFEDASDAYVESILERLSEATALVPALWPLEVANVLLVAERGKRLRVADSARFVELLSALPIVIDETTPARATGPILSLARQTGLSSYDAAYLELAMREDLPLATRDRHLRAAAKKAGASLLSG